MAGRKGAGGRASNGNTATTAGTKRERSDSQMEQAALLTNIGGAKASAGAAIAAALRSPAVKTERAGNLTPLVTDGVANDLAKNGSTDQLTDTSAASNDALAAAAAAVAVTGKTVAEAAGSAASDANSGAGADPFQTSLPFKKRRKTGDGGSQSSLADLPSAAALSSVPTSVAPASAATTTVPTTAAAKDTKDTDSESGSNNGSGDGDASITAAPVEQTMLDVLARGSSCDSL